MKFKVLLKVEPQLQMRSYRNTKNQESEKMKYVIFMEYKEPIEKNIQKVIEIEKGRIDRGEAWIQGTENLAHYMMIGEHKSFMIVETDDPSKLAKWATTYYPYLKYKISPVMTRKEYEKAIK